MKQIPHLLARSGALLGCLALASGVALAQEVKGAKPATTGAGGRRSGETGRHRACASATHP